MRGLLRRRPTPALVISIIALCLALGGSAMAITVKLGKNDVKSKNIKKNAVTKKKIKDGAVTDEKTKHGVLPRGFASVLETGTLQASGGVVVGVSRPSQGVYCFDLTEAVNAGVATLESSGSGIHHDIAASTIANPPCVAPFTDFRVDTHPPTGVHANDPFYLAFF
jgi:hypothetical protein